MIVEEVINSLETIAPREYAAEWDNVGLLIGSRRWEVDSILLTIDLTDAVMREAVEFRGSRGGRMVVSYHPPIFEALRSLTDATDKQRIALEAASRKIAVYSSHTALDAAPGGVNDWLASCFGSGDVRALVSHESLPQSEQCKIITFCPADAVDRVRNGLAAVGAGRIGNYQLCSFETPGTGTFLGGEDTSPKVGGRGSLQRVDEIRLEMVCSKSALGLAMIALREFHPYEEPPIEIHPLLPRPQRNIGQGRRVTLDQPLSLRAIVARLKRHLAIAQVQVAVGDRAPAKYDRIGLCAGAGGSLLDAALEHDCRLFVSGEMRHHDVLAAQARSCTVLLAGHTNTERGYLKVLRKRLGEMLEAVEVRVSKRDGDPLRSM